MILNEAYDMGRRNNMTRMIAIAMALIALASFNARNVHAGDGVELAGDILQIVLPAAAGGMTIMHSDRKGALQFGKSTTLTLAVTFGLKYAINAKRPDGGSRSFPSGHTSISFCSAEFLRKRYGLEYGLPSYAVASFVAYSRVESRRHYPRDVFAGAAIGVISSYVFTKPCKGWRVDANGCGFRLLKSW